MPKRNFILLITILALIIIGLFGFLYLRSGTTPVEVVSNGTNFLSMFNPFRSNPSTPGTTPPETNTPGEDQGTQSGEVVAENLKKVSTMPIAGFTIFSKERLKEVPVVVPPPSTTDSTTTPATTTTPTTTTPATPPSAAPVKKAPVVKPVPPKTEFAEAVRYVERATGNIYQTFVDKIEEKKFSQTVIPKIYDAYFGNQGMSVVMRHLKLGDATIETFYGLLPKEKFGEDLTNNEIKGSFLPDNVKDISLSPDASKIFYLLNVGNSAVGTILNLADGKKTQIFNSVFSEWNSNWGSANTITLTTKPSGAVPGYMYAINVGTKNFSNVLGNVNGLTTLMSPSGKLVLVGNGSLSLYIYHTDTKAFDQLGVNTLPEKCTWNKMSDAVYCAVPTFITGATYPDDWYRGEISFSDQIWKINIKDGNTKMIADPLAITNPEDIDGIKLAVDNNENYLFFVNKKDSFLWELSLK
ncbi:MAG: hypothetical protein KGL67_00545 [Patescibacteria group bacterium]|nr:hypothetical protein [Patescibacteria group bacterium]